jgi:uncharacterized integral membrane protein
MLKWLRAALTLIVLCTSVLFGGLFATQNTQLVPLVLGNIAVDAQPVAVWLLLFLILGVGLGSLLGSALLIKQRASSMRLRRENARLLARLERDTDNG